MTDTGTSRGSVPLTWRVLQELANHDQVPVRFILDTVLRLGLAEMADAAQWVAHHERQEQDQAADDPLTIEEATWVGPKRMSGTPCFRNCRFPVENPFDWLDDFHLDRHAVAGILLAAAKMLSDQLENLPSGAPDST